MAKIIAKNVESDVVNDSRPIWQASVLGLVLGVFFWFITLVSFRYNGSLGVSGNIATILAATLGIIIMLNLRMARPLLVSVAVAISLWGLAKITEGLSEIEIVFWSALLYGLAYTLFYWLNRYKRIIPLLVAAIITVVIIRIAITL